MLDDTTTWSLKRGAVVEQPEQGWNCKECNVRNKPHKLVCDECGHPKLRENCGVCGKSNIGRDGVRIEELRKHPMDKVRSRCSKCYLSIEEEARERQEHIFEAQLYNERPSNLGEMFDTYKRLFKITDDIESQNSLKFKVDDKWVKMNIDHSLQKASVIIFTYNKEYNGVINNLYKMVSWKL